MSEFLLVPVLLFASFLAAIGTIFCLIRIVYLVRNKNGLLPYIFYISTFGNILLGITSGRNLITLADNNPSDIDLTTSPSYVIWISRLISMLLLFAASQRLASRLIHYGSKPNTPTLLIITLLFFFFTNVFTAALFSTHPSVEHDYIYIVLVGTASLLLVQGEEEIPICVTRNAFFIFLVISAGFIPWNLGLVMSNNYLDGLIPGLTYRYVGLASHPNTLGLITTLFLLCLWNKPFSSRWLNFFGWIIGFSSLVFAQSKTCWISFIICMSCLGYFKYGDFLKQRLFCFKNPILPTIIILMTMLIVSVITGLVMFGDLESKINSFYSTGTAADLMTMTGRDMIWEVALNEWRNSPLFGYGLTIWDVAHRAKIGMPYAVTAHSQFYQTLASAGITGVAGLLIYVATLFWFTMKTAKSSQGLTLAIFLILLIRSISEVSLNISGHWDYDATAHLLLLMIIGAQSLRDRSRVVPRSDSACVFTQLAK